MNTKSQKAIEILDEAKQIQIKKSTDYQNPKSRVKQAQYYPRGCATISDRMSMKVLRIQSVLEAMELDPDYKANYESLEDSALDLINYSSFFISYLRGGIDGQDPKRDFLNRPGDPKAEDI